MSTFKVGITRIEQIDPIEGADRIEVATIHGYQTIVGKGQFKRGDLIAYIPEASLVPDDVAKTLGVFEKLSGSRKNRVKAVRFKGVLSQGLAYPTFDNMEIRRGDKAMFIPIGTDVSEFLGIEKYEPQVPATFAGSTSPLYMYRYNYDIENLKHTPKALDNRFVEVTEKLHGTLMCIVAIPGLNHEQGFFGGNILVSSKGLLKNGFFLKDVPNNEGNVYVRALKQLYETNERFQDFVNVVNNSPTLPPTYLFGELVGKGIQDLDYNTPIPTYVMFDIYEGISGEGKMLSPGETTLFCKNLVINHAPVLYVGQYDPERLLEWTEGKSTVAEHMREGVVFKTIDAGKRIILKSISAQYLTRKDGTEYV
jgi:RNA ligase (TIGR02306 family)